MKIDQSEELAEEARHLVKLNHSEVPSIVRSYVFEDPEGKEIRVVHVDSKAFPEVETTPFMFGPDPQYKLFHPMWIALVDLGGPERLDPPEGWGSWSDATVIERKRRKAS